MGATKLSINVTGIEEVLLSFNVIRIKRSTTGVDGTYSFLTNNVPVAATLLAPLAGNYNLLGKTLQLHLDQDPLVSVLFTGLDPLTVPQVMDQINAAVGAAVAFDDANHLRLTSTRTGTISKVEIVGGSAAPIFGWPDGTRNIGKEANINLIAGISSYTFIDQDGQAGYFYTAQFYNTSTQLSSNDSTPFEGDVGTLVDAARLSRVEVNLVDARGIAVADQEITFYSVNEPLEVDGFQVAMIRSPVSIKTDNSGHAEVSLIRGLLMRVVFEGTSVIREIRIPDVESFDLLQLMSSAPDPFKIKELNFPTAPRRTI